MTSKKQTQDIADFLGHLANERRLSAHTIEAGKRDLARLHRFLEKRNIRRWDEVRAPLARAFIADLHGGGLSGRSIRRVLSSVRSFYRYLHREKRASVNPFDGQPVPRVERALPKALSPDEALKLVEIKPTDALALRDCAMLELTYGSGLRLAELVSLDLNDLTLDDADAEVRVTGKGGKTRIVPVGRHALRALRAWLACRKGLGAPGEAALFVGRRGARIGARAVQKRFGQWGVRQQLHGKVTPHMLRHSFASHLLQSSGDLKAVQELLGHANLSTTQIYTHLDFQYLAGEYDKAHPRARKRS